MLKSYRQNRFVVATCAAIVAAPLSGCAALVESVTDRGIMSDRLNQPGKDPNRLKSMMGDRRLLRVIRLDPDSTVDAKQKFLVCPEPFSGAIIARGAKDGISVTKLGSTSDEVTQTAVSVDTRAEAVRMYEDQSAWLCFERASGDLTPGGYVERMDKLGIRAFEKVSPPKESSGQEVGSTSTIKAGKADLQQAAKDSKARADEAAKVAADLYAKADAAAKAAATANAPAH